jgi:hypothetical protein
MALPDLPSARLPSVCGERQRVATVQYSTVWHRHGSTVVQYRSMVSNFRKSDTEPGHG